MPRSPHDSRNSTPLLQPTLDPIQGEDGDGEHDEEPETATAPDSLASKPSFSSLSGRSDQADVTAPQLKDTSPVNNTLVTPKGERPLFGEWVGTWWAKGKTKGGRDTPSSAITDESPGSGLSQVETPSGVDSDNASAVSDAASSKSRRKVTGSRSVFGTLGFSILNPGSSSSKKQRTTSVTDVASLSAEAGSDEPPIPSASPESPRALDSLSPADTASIAAPEPSILASTRSPQSTTSRSATEGRPPQGSSLRAIVHATRLMTSDPSSILADQGRDTSPLIAQLAFELVRNAREQDLELREPPRERKERLAQQSMVVVHANTHAQVASTADGESSSSDVARLITPASNGQTQRRGHQSRKPSVNLPSLASPFFSTFLQAQQHKKGSGPTDVIQKNTSDPTSSTQGAPNTSVSPQATTAKPGSVPLESIIPTNSKPPTQYLSRTYTPLTSRDFHFSIPLPDTGYDERKTTRELMTDRYGFVYEPCQYDHLLLLRAKQCGNTAPACLTGIKVADRKEDDVWPGEDEDVKTALEIVKGICDCDGSGDASETMSINTTSTRPPLQSAVSSDAITTSSRPRSRASSPAPSRTRSRTSPTITKAYASVLTIDADTPRHVCSNTIRMLLQSMTDIHDQRQKTQRKEWDAFVSQRSKSARNATTYNSKFASSAGGAAQLLGLGTAVDEEELSHTEGLIGFAQLGLSANRDERREFDRLIRSGIPLVYRNKVWFECSGGLEMKEPGLFHDLLAQADGENFVLKEIDKDVGRTMPLNVFFGRTGAGVEKLRRVLTAYSRCVGDGPSFPVSFMTYIFHFQTEQSCGLLPGHELGHVNVASRSCR